MLGRTFFREQFGVDSPVLWLLDVFGYAWQLPQLIKSAGPRVLLHHENQLELYNRLPYDSFWWQGWTEPGCSPTSARRRPPMTCTGTPTTPWPGLPMCSARGGTTCTATPPPQEKPPQLMSYGWGDGGGGPTREMVENLAVMADFDAAGVRAAGPWTSSRSSISAAGHAYQRGTGSSTRVPPGHVHDSWGREASQPPWRSPCTMPNCSRPGQPSLAGADYPAERLDEAWKLLCLNQFHDILPGSSIAEVYVDAAKDHTRIASIAAQIIDDAVHALSPLWHADTRHVAINPTAFGGRLRATIPTSPTSGTSYVDVRTGSELAQQAIEGGTLVEIEADAFGVVEIGERQTAAHRPEPRRVLAPGGSAPVSSGRHRRRRLRIGERDPARRTVGGGEITRFSTRSIVEVVRPDRPANVFQAFEDRPVEFDAWNIDLFINDRQWSAEPGRAPRSSRMARPRIDRISPPSRCKHDRPASRLCRNDRRIDFATSVDWQERHTMLKVAFPVGVLAQVATARSSGATCAQHPHELVVGLGTARDMRPQVGRSQ